MMTAGTDHRVIAHLPSFSPVGRIYPRPRTRRARAPRDLPTSRDLLGNDACGGRWGADGEARRVCGHAERLPRVPHAAGSGVSGFGREEDDVGNNPACGDDGQDNIVEVGVIVEANEPRLIRWIRVCEGDEGK